MIEIIAADIAQKLKAVLPFVTDVKYIARQDPSGIVMKENPEEPTGIDDRNEGGMYLRFRDGWDEMFTAGNLISGRNMIATARLRCVFMHACRNELEIARFIASAIMNCENHSLRYGVKIRTKSTDKQFIYTAETKQKEGMKDNRLRLIMVDFDVTYKESFPNDPKCIPSCDVC